ncbi:redoxin family protein [Trinickia sp.]|uniref:redoxin family protein n=1 Tax=Trinickia sp. TaxID=2571163 RepID=UPI003F7F0C54
MTIPRVALAALALSAALITFWSTRQAAATAAGSQLVEQGPAPGFEGADRWYNSPPLSLDALRGKVVLVEFWTRECINCIHVLPHTRALYDTYAKDGLVIIGVHTPEYAEERDPSALQAAMKQFGVIWPVAVDNESRIWNAYGNRYWPALYLIDRSGHVVYRHYGEGDYEQTEARIRALLGKA